MGGYTNARVHACLCFRPEVLCKEPSRKEGTVKVKGEGRGLIVLVASSAAEIILVADLFQVCLPRAPAECQFCEGPALPRLFTWGSPAPSTMPVGWQLPLTLTAPLALPSSGWRIPPLNGADCAFLQPSLGLVLPQWPAQDT